MATSRARCCAAWEAAGRTTETPPSPGLEGPEAREGDLREAAPGRAALLRASVLVRAGPGPTALGRQGCARCWGDAAIAVSSS